MSFNIERSSAARREIRRIRDDDDRLRIERFLQSLAQGPYLRGATKLKGSRRRWRARVGDYRIVYDIYSNERVVEIVRVALRNESTYRGL